MKLLTVKRLILTGLIFIAVFGIGCKYLIYNYQNLSSNQISFLPVIFSLAMIFILFLLVLTWFIYYLIDENLKRPIIRRVTKIIIGVGNAVIIFITICVLSILFSGPPYSNDELLNQYFDMPASDFRDVHIYYNEMQEVLCVYFRFQMNGEAADKRMQEYLKKYCSNMENYYSVDKIKNTVAGGPSYLKWWNPKITNNKTLYIGRFKGKRVDNAEILIDEDGKTIYVMLMYAFSDPKTMQKKQ